MKFVVLLLCVLGISACQEDTKRQVVMVESPAGHSFAYMQINEPGKTDVSINVAWPTDWARDASLNPMLPTVASEALLNSGTKQFSSAEIMNGFNERNARARVYASPDHMRGVLNFPKEHMAFVLDVASAALAEPTYDPIWLQRAHQGVLDQVAHQNGETHFQMWAAARTAVLAEDPLDRYLSMRVDTSESEVSRQAAQDWHKNVFTQANAVVAVEGVLSEAEAGAAVDQLLAGLPEGRKRAADMVSAAPAAQVNFAPRRIFLHLPDAGKTTMGLLGQLPDTTSPGEETDLLALHFFGRQDGALITAMREELRASYVAQTGAVNYDRATRLFYIYSEVGPEKLAQALELAAQTYGQFRTQPDFAGFEVFQERFSADVGKNIGYFDVAANAVVELMLDGRDPAGAPSLDKQFAEATQQAVAKRLQDAFPAAEDLIWLAAGPDASQWPEACVITDIAEAALCPTEHGF
ncbi:MAG: M16 family metallopeptidase [Cognatishimia sp.]